MNFNISANGLNGLTWIQVLIYFLCMLVPFTSVIRRGKTLSKSVKRLRSTIGFLGFIVLSFDIYLCVLFFANMQVPPFIEKYPFIYKYGIVAFAYLFWLFFRSSIKKEVVLESFDYKNNAYDVMNIRTNNEINTKEKFMDLDKDKPKEELELLDFESDKETK